MSLPFRDTQQIALEAEELLPCSTAWESHRNGDLQNLSRADG